MENVVFGIAGFVYFAPMALVLGYIIYDMLKDVLKK